jgi:hypothetical protein
MLSSFEVLCPSVIPGHPILSHTFASKYKQHILFFVTLNIFEETDLFHVWYPVERELRFEIFRSGLFDRTNYEMRVNVAITSHKQLQVRDSPTITPPNSSFRKWSGCECYKPDTDD